MNILASFRSDSLNQGLTRYESRGMVKVVITLLFHWLLRQQQARRSIEWILENIHQAVRDTYVHAEYLLTSTVEIDAQTGHSRPVWHPVIHREEPGINYTVTDNHMSPDNWYHRYYELAEYLLTYYTRPVMGFYTQVQKDKHLFNVECIEFTDYYITVIARCYNLIEYKEQNP